MDILKQIFQNQGNVDILVGAGISYNSGIPLAIPLLKKCFDVLGCELDDANSLVKENQIQTRAFESFIEIFLHSTEPQYLLKVFNSGVPDINHRVNAELFTRNRLSTVFTTNFDQLIEQALNNFSYSSYITETDLADFYLDDQKSIVKLHGCITNTESLQTTIESIW